MAIFRFIHTDFWTDDYFLELTPEDKYFYIYLLTNGRCSQCGIYSFAVKLASLELGYNEDTVRTLLQRFVDYGKILYSKATGEVMILNWYKYNLNLKNKNTRVCINTCLKKVKNKEFLNKFYELCIDGNQSDISLVMELFNKIDIPQIKSDTDNCALDNNEEIIEKDTYMDKETLGRNGETATSEVISEDEFTMVATYARDKLLSISCEDLCIIRQLLQKVSAKVIMEAIDLASYNNKFTMAYVYGILKNWIRDGTISKLG